LDQHEPLATAAPLIVAGLRSSGAPRQLQGRSRGAGNATAISHQIRQLEEWLDCRVLERSPRAVSLTQQGKILHDATRTSFGHIAQAVDRLRKTGQRRVLTFSSTAAFLSHWLMPRIEDLQRAVPHVDLRLHASDVLENLWAGGIDMAIRYGKGHFPVSTARFFAATNCCRCAALSWALPPLPILPARASSISMDVGVPRPNRIGHAGVLGLD
jgi:DNA-binding transcriptional LysR family regulator